MRYAKRISSNGHGRHGNDIRKIEYFVAVIEQGNISAAEALRVSQPTLSRQIHALERQFNTPLFIRHGRGMVPTIAPALPGAFPHSIISARSMESNPIFPSLDRSYCESR
jgi:hypothetical protein